MAKLKDIINEGFSVVGGVVSTPAIGRSADSLSNIVEDMYGKQEKVSAKEIQESMKQFVGFSEVFQNQNNISEIAETLSNIANNAKSYTLSETDDWFDKVSVNKNMKSLKGSVVEFQKAAKEAHQLNQRMTALYEDIGHVLGRYFEMEGGEPSSEESDEKVKAGLDGTPVEGSNIKEGDYEAFFQGAMKKFGISSPDELDDEKKKEFFNYIDSNYSGKKETD